MEEWEKGFVAGIYVLSPSDITNWNIRLSKARFLFEKQHVGGDTESEKARETLEVEFSPGRTVERFVFGNKKLLNDRSRVTREFFRAIQAKAGDRLLIERIGARHLRISKA